MTAVVATASEQPGHASPPPVAVHSEAFLVTCILAEHPASPGCLEHMALGRISAVVRVAQATHARRHLLEWFRRVEPSEYCGRWEAARALVGRVYKELPGARSLPDFYGLELGQQ